MGGNTVFLYAAVLCVFSILSQRCVHIEGRLVSMPKRPKKPCAHPGCPGLTDGKFCGEHEVRHRGDRPSASKRGYGSRWQKARARYLRSHPMCVKCQEDGRYVKATVVDHICPHRGDPVLMWDETNWQSLCKPCHDKKTFNEDANPTYHY